MEFENKNVLVTGAASGIGKGISSLFARLGARVLLIDKNIDDGKKAVKEISVDGGKSNFFYLDLTEISSIRDVVASIISKHKKIDILINNAGICPMDAFTDIDIDRWDSVIRINLTSVFFLTREVSRFMIERKYGKIVNISSISAKMGGVNAPPHYVASKGGLDSLTRYFAKKLASFNINVNAISGSATMTNITKSFTKSMLDNLIKITPLNRLSTVSDIAKAVVFLASDDSGFITGEVLNVSGGLYMD